MGKSRICHAILVVLLSSVAIAQDVDTEIDWDQLIDYPATCGPGNFVQTLADTPTCAADDDAPEAGDFGALALTGDVTSVGLATTISANSVALTTDTTGDYVDAVLGGVGIAVTHTPAEGSDATVAFKYTDTEASNSLGAEETVFTTDGTGGGLLFEGSTADTIEGLLVWAPATSSKTITLPNETGTACTTGSVCTGYQAGPLTGDVTTSGAAATIDPTLIVPTSVTTPYVKVGPDNLGTFLNVKWDPLDVAGARYEAISDTTASYPWALGIEGRRDMEFNDVSNKVVFYSAFNANTGGTYAGTVNFSTSALLRMDNLSILRFSAGSLMDVDSGGVIGFDSGAILGLASGGVLRLGTTASITAGDGAGSVGTTQAGAATLSCQECEVSTVTATDNAVRMSDCSGTYLGEWKLIHNDDSADTMNLYPDTGGDVGAGTNAAVTIPPNITVFCGCYSTDVWDCATLLPVVRPAAYTQTYSTADRTHANPTAATLTDSTTGTADQTVADVGAAFSQATLNNNFADLTDEVNKIVADMADIKQLVNALIDDCQANGGCQ